LRQAIAISDLHTALNDEWRRDQTRMNAAFVLAQMGQFDEAIALGEEALALQRTPRSPRTQLSQTLEQIRQMKKLAGTVAAARIDP
jgi:hypothetical protein